MFWDGSLLLFLFWVVVFYAWGHLLGLGYSEDLYFGILLVLSVSFFLTTYDITTAAFFFLPDLWVFYDTFFLFGMGRRFTTILCFRSLPWFRCLLTVIITI